MIFLETKLPGVYEIQVERKADERGFFARTWCQEEFASHGLNPGLVQCSVSFNARKGTLRGMHYQAAPFPETKVVRCTQGSLFDVVVDLRPQSPTFRQWVGVTLTPAKRNMMYVPENCAHGFITLEDETEIFYQISEFFKPELSRGVRWNDPAFKIDWPEPVTMIAERDRTYPAFKAE
jgi:dTDP-4-dehydrorhamnose 3,5-epimerase